MDDLPVYLESTGQRNGGEDKLVEDSLRKEIAVQLRALRASAGLTQTALSKKCGIAQEVICRLEGYDRHMPSLATLRRLADAMGYDVHVTFIPSTIKVGLIMEDEHTGVTAGHTPGPWCINHVAMGIFVQNGTAQGCRQIARVDNGNHHRGEPAKVNREDEANARLIAAAPDLLEALERILHERVFSDDGIGHEALDQARAAIAKARKPQT